MMSNSPNAPNQKPKFNRSIRLRWLIALIFLLITGCSESPQVPVSTSLVIPTPTNVQQEAEATIVIEAITEVSLEPTATAPLPPSPTPLPVDLRLGYTERGMNCSFITEMVSLVLEQELNLNIEVAGFETADDLFTALAEQEIDVTLCYIDPDDRAEMKDRLGTIRQIGANYWANEQSKLQIWANGASKADLRNQTPCALSFLENFQLKDLTFKESAQAWIQNHANEVQAWISCVPLN